VEERWHLSRGRAARSRPPDKILAFNCAKCGGPVEKSQDERCQYCGALFGTAEFDWLVKSIELLRMEKKGPLLTGTVEEQGTQSPTIFQPNFTQQLSALQAKDPAFSMQAFEKSLCAVFEKLQTAWSSLKWEQVKAVATDRFYLSQLYWIEAYRKQGLRNILTGAAIQKWQAVKVVLDPYFDAITVRLWGSGLDYTEEAATGRLVAGSKSKHRSYSEYWTLIRSAVPKTNPSESQNCPNCGAPLAINMSGNCQSCGSKVLSGTFDWCLSRIEQDEVYVG
jgi:DNA-directed RNA polymerase subunit RPC12/RpoP